MSNTELWKKYAKPNTKFVKDVAYGARKYKAINPEYDAERATEEWGPYGEGWGLRDVEYDYLPSKEEPRTLIMHAQFFYKRTIDDEGEAFPISVDMPFKLGDDTFKKIRTMAQSKALSLLGFNSEIFKGMWDDAKYVSEIEAGQDEENKLLPKIWKAIKSAKTTAQLDSCAERATEIHVQGNMTEGAYEEIVKMIEDAQSKISLSELGNLQKTVSATITQKIGVSIEDPDTIDAVCRYVCDLPFTEMYHSAESINKFLTTYNDLSKGGMSPSDIIKHAKEDASADK